jgi:NAD(P) transhydrogenase
MSYDLVVIGGGPAGEKAAAAAAFFGKKVALIERAAPGPGGATVHTGTLPSKTLRETALYITGFHRLELYKGIPWSFEGSGRSVRDLMCRLPSVTNTQSTQIRQNIERHGIELVQGQARLLDATHVEVGDRVFETRFVLVATGSSPRHPPGFDFDDGGVFDSDSLLHLDRIPDTLAVIGGGVIGSEYACVFATLGVKIEIIEGSSRLLGFLDEEISDALMAAMREQGITIHVNAGVERLERKNDKLLLTLKSGETMLVDKALVSAGRTGNSGGIGLDKAGVALDARGCIQVDADFRTNVRNIFAAGDVIGKPSLASASMEQGRIAVAAMFELAVPARDWNAIPSGIYTIPEACSLGPTEGELRTQRVPYVVGRSAMRHNARGQISGDTHGFVKLIFHQENKKLLAVHLICERATELIHIGQAVMRLGGGIDYFLESVMTYPSLSVAFKYAAYDALGELARGRARPSPLA